MKNNKVYIVEMFYAGESIIDEVFVDKDLAEDYVNFMNETADTGA